MVLNTKTKRRPNSSDKRRIGRHHPKDDNYLKHYWPYIPIGLIVAFGIAANSFLNNFHNGVLGYATATSVSGLLNETNNQRVANGLGNLVINGKLNAAAQAKANDMASRNYWSHNTPDGQAPWIFFVNAGYDYQTAGENLAYGFDNSAGTITAWMNSPAHRENVLNNTYQEVGFGMADAADYQGSGPETIVVAMYGSPQPIAAAPAAAAKPAPAAQTPTTTPAAQETPVAAPTEQAKETNTVNTAPAVEAAKQSTPKTVTTQNVSRVQLLTNGAAPWSMFVVSAIAVICIAVFFLRHGLLLHKVLVRGETFIHKHPFLDIALVTVSVAGFLLSRTAGVIH